ncbi:MAG: hypothetical protein ACPHIB_09290 [Thalassobaculaceae bacterium]
MSNVKNYPGTHSLPLRPNDYQGLSFGFTILDGMSLSIHQPASPPILS